MSFEVEGRGSMGSGVLNAEDMQTELSLGSCQKGGATAFWDVASERRCRESLSPDDASRENVSDLSQAFIRNMRGVWSLFITEVVMLRRRDGLK